MSMEVGEKHRHTEAPGILRHGHQKIQKASGRYFVCHFLSYVFLLKHLKPTYLLTTATAKCSTATLVIDFAAMSILSLGEGDPLVSSCLDTVVP